MLLTIVAIAATGLAVAGSELAPSAESAGGSFGVLQLNLCNSGLAACYSGQARSGAITLINERRPSAVTLNEACEEDLRSIRAATGYVGVFTQSGSQLCTNGSRYGNAIVFPAGTRVGRAQVTEYVHQDSEVERRTLTCVPADGVSTCVTHLSSGGSRYAQAAEMAVVLARHAARGATVVGGDWNLTAPRAQGFVPAGLFRRGDGEVQHIAATDDFRFVREHRQGLPWTDHPAFEVYLRR